MRKIFGKSFNSGIILTETAAQMSQYYRETTNENYQFSCRKNKDSFKNFTHTKV